MCSVGECLALSKSVAATPWYNYKVFGGWAAGILDGQEKGNPAGGPEESRQGEGERKMDLVSPVLTTTTSRASQYGVKKFD